MADEPTPAGAAIPPDTFRSTDEAEEANAEATAIWLANQPKPGDDPDDKR